MLFNFDKTNKNDVMRELNCSGYLSRMLHFLDTLLHLINVCQ